MTKKLTRSANEQFFGVAAGLANYFNMDTTIMRLLWVIATLIIGPQVALFYLALAVFLPKADSATSSFNEADIIIEKDPASFA